MSQEQGLTRREFTAASVLAMLSGVVITISETGCGGSDYSSGPSPNPTPAPNPTPTPSGSRMGTIGSNHGHTAEITAAQLGGGQDITLDIRGQATHPHTVTISVSELTSIAGNQRVSKESTTDEGHSHTVTFN